jgi:hypothetical protein
VQDPSPSLARRIGLKKGEGRFRTHRDEEDKWMTEGIKNKTKGLRNGTQSKGRETL